MAVRGGGSHVGQLPGGLLVGPVLQQPCEQEIPRLEEIQVLLLVLGVVWQKAMGLEGQESRCYDEELAGPPQVPIGTHMRDELVGDLGQGELGHVEAAARDQAQKQVEGALELGQGDGETGNARCRALLAVHGSGTRDGCRFRWNRRVRLRRHCRGR